MMFKVEPPCRLFVDTLVHYRAEGAYLLHAFVLMRDHFHALITPGKEMTIAARCAARFGVGGGWAIRYR